MLLTVVGASPGLKNRITSALEASDVALRFAEKGDPVPDDASLLIVSIDAKSDLDYCRSVREFGAKTPFVLALLKGNSEWSATDLFQAGVDDCADGVKRLALRVAIMQERMRRLQVREGRFRSIVETTVDGIVVIDDGGIIQTFNPSAERIFGYTAEQAIGQNLSLLMPEPYHSEHDSYLENYHHSGRRKVIGIGREVTGRRSDGSEFPMDLAVSEMQVDGKSTYTGIVRDISERRRLENEVLRISDQERRRIGQDLHDGLGQMLTGIGLISQNLGRQLRQQGQDAADDLDEITEMIRDADQQARSLARGLVPVELDANGLAAGLQRLVSNAQRLFGVSCSFEEIGESPVRDSTTAINLYRIAQEAVSNAAKHASPNRIRVTLASGPDQVRLRIQDDGIGFHAGLKGHESGMGVRIMHYRARVVGAQLEIRSEPRGGTTVTCSLHRTVLAQAVFVPGNLPANVS